MPSNSSIQVRRGGGADFLGMTQAQVTCRRRLRIPMLAHLDTLLRLLGATLAGKRPISSGLTSAARSSPSLWSRRDGQDRWDRRFNGREGTGARLPACGRFLRTEGSGFGIWIPAEWNVDCAAP